MFGFKDLYLFVRQRKRLIAGLLVFNVLVTFLAISVFLKPRHTASVQIVFNDVRYSFKSNRANDYLYNQKGDEERRFAFVNLLVEDSLILQTAQALHMADHYQLLPDDPERDRKASEIMRRTLYFKASEPISEPALRISFTDADPEVAQQVLTDVVERVDALHRKRNEANNRITQQNATVQIERVAQEVKEVEAELATLSTIRKQDQTAGLRWEYLTSYYQRKLTQLAELREVVQVLDDHQNSGRYQSYYIVHDGAVTSQYSLLVILLLALMANVLGLIFEFQLIFILRYLNVQAGKREEAQSPN